MAAPMRSKGGNPTAAARDKHGMPDGSYPVWDPQSADSAIGLRNNSDHSAASVLSHVAKQAKTLGIPGVADKVKAARAEDRAKK